MKIVVHNFEHSDRAKDAVALLKEHMPTGWDVTEVEVSSFGGDVTAQLSLPYKTGTREPWYVGKFFSQCEPYYSGGGNINVAHGHNGDRMIVSFNRLLPGKVTLHVHIPIAPKEVITISI